MNIKKAEPESLENPSSQTHKLKISYVVNESTAPIPILGGIFSTFGVDRNTGIKYYNYFENQKHKEMKSSNNSNSTSRPLVNNNNNNNNNNTNNNDKLINRILLKKLK